MIGAILLLFIGTAAGIGGYYYWDSTHPQVAVVAPAIQEMKTNDIPLTTFEESRRLVNEDPNKYIAANPNPLEAQDYFLLGQAYMLTGQWFQAKNAFNTAKSRISEFDPKDRPTISHEIELNLAVISNGPATDRFKWNVLQIQGPTGRLLTQTRLRKIVSSCEIDQPVSLPRKE